MRVKAKKDVNGYMALSAKGGSRADTLIAKTVVRLRKKGVIPTPTHHGGEDHAGCREIYFHGLKLVGRDFKRFKQEIREELKKRGK